MVDPVELETVAMLERALNYAHTGSARVLTKRLMDRAWLSLSVVNDGLPCISNSFIQAGSLSSGLVTVRRDKWPVHPITRIPLTASQRSQELTYGKAHFAVSHHTSASLHAVPLYCIIANASSFYPPLKTKQNQMHYIAYPISAHFWTSRKCVKRTFCFHAFFNPFVMRNFHCL